MTEKYKVLLSIKAKEDLKNIVFYIKNNLREPVIASKYVKIIKDEIKLLSYFPQRNEIIDDDIIKDLKIRKLIIRNYIAFYRINEENNIVNIERILYSASDWIKEL